MKKILLIVSALVIMKLSFRTKEEKFVMRQSKEVVTSTTVRVTATMYMPTKGQCDNTPLITACGKKINPKKASEHKWIAVSRDLLKVFKYGDKVKLSNAGDKNGIYTITDTMNKRFKNKIDILETVGTPLYKLNDVVLTKVS
jgi:3D (Asp-Asp-Asp) domain-containing protein